MGQEIRQQIEALATIPCSQSSGCHIRETTPIIHQTSHEDNQRHVDKCACVSMGEKTSRKHKKALNNKIEDLEDALQNTQDKLNQYKKKAANQLRKQKNDMNGQYQENVAQINRDVESLRLALREEQHKHKHEMNRLKHDAKQVINFVRSKANEAIAETEAKHKETIKELQDSMSQKENEYKDRVSSHLVQMEHQICDVMRLERAAIVTGMNSSCNKKSSSLPKSEDKCDHPYYPRARSFFPDDTLTTMSENSPPQCLSDSKECNSKSCTVEALDGLTEALVDNVRRGFQSILDGKEKDLIKNSRTIAKSSKINRVIRRHLH
jgi:uncharacterized phage infection (PIP) family protein YhgE